LPDPRRPAVAASSGHSHSDATEETAMSPAFHHDLAKARIADLHHHAAQARMAKAAIRAQRHHRTRSVPAHTVTALARRVLTLASGRPSPAR
jgi:hypothetical protein